MTLGHDDSTINIVMAIIIIITAKDNSPKENWSNIFLTGRMWLRPGTIGLHETGDGGHPADSAGMGIDVAGI